MAISLSLPFTPSAPCTKKLASPHLNYLSKVIGPEGPRSDQCHEDRNSAPGDHLVFNEREDAIWGPPPRLPRMLENRICYIIQDSLYYYSGSLHIHLHRIIKEPKEFRAMKHHSLLVYNKYLSHTPFNVSECTNSSWQGMELHFRHKFPFQKCVLKNSVLDKSPNVEAFSSRKELIFLKPLDFLNK